MKCKRCVGIKAEYADLNLQIPTPPGFEPRLPQWPTLSDYASVIVKVVVMVLMVMSDVIVSPV